MYKRTTEKFSFNVHNFLRLAHKGYYDKDTDFLSIKGSKDCAAATHAYLPFSEVFKQICSSSLIILISDFMEQDKLLPYNLESNRRTSDQGGRSFG